jgi:radical SAM superfamily enzyme YgiQ (UPF0313 family)
MGEAEIVLDDFIDAFCDVKLQNRGRQEALVHLARHVESLYVPSLYGIRYNGDGTIHSRVPHVDRIPDTIRVRRDNLFRSGVASSLIRAPASEFGDRVLVELGRGCSRSCRFCAAGYVYRPPRFNEEKAVKDRIEAVLKGHKRVGLVSAAVSDAPGIENIADLIIKKGGEFSVSSLRADSLTEALVGHLKKAGQRTLAIAPEAGSERLRKVINKHLSQDDITRSVSMISSMGGFSLRLYFLIGLPTETRQDIADIPRLIRRIKHRMVKASRKRGTIGQLRLSVNCFVPKPFTPFQWIPLESPTTLKEKQKWLRRALSKEGGVKVNFDVPKWAYVQALLSLGDRRAGAILFLTHQYRGNWRKAFRHSEINPDFFVQRPKALEEVLPWDFIDHGIQKTHLAREYELALEGKESEICRVGDCKRCGVC